MTEGALYSLILYEVAGNVATITLNRPKRGNAITPEMGAEVVSAVARAESDRQVAAVVLTGSGRFFCTGMDLGSGNQEQLEEDLRTGVAAERSIALFTALRNLKKPLIVRMNGPAYGGGCGLLFVGDIRVADAKSFICFSEVRRGLVPALIGAFIVQQMGESLAMQYMTTGMKLQATEMYRLGLVADLADDKAQLDEKVGHLCQQLRLCAPGAVSATKANVRFCATHLHEENIEHVKKTFSKFIHSSEAMHGLAAFARKEDPKWMEYAREKQQARL